MTLKNALQQAMEKEEIGAKLEVIKQKSKEEGGITNDDLLAFQHQMLARKGLRT